MPSQARAPEHLWQHQATSAGDLQQKPNELAETAFLQLPTLETPNKFHIYKGTQCSRTIEQEHIPSWWVVLAIVLHETNRAQQTPTASTSHSSSSTPATSKRTPNSTSAQRSCRFYFRTPACTSPSGHYTMKRHSQQQASPSMFRPGKTSPPFAHHTCASHWQATLSTPSLSLPHSEATPTSGTT